MATVHITAGLSVDGIAPVIAAVPRLKERITSSGTSQQSAAAMRRGETCTITVTGGNIYAQIGPNPTASAGNDWLILDGQTRDFGFVNNGDLVAIIDA